MFRLLRYTLSFWPKFYLTPHIYFQVIALCLMSYVWYLFTELEKTRLRCPRQYTKLNINSGLTVYKPYRTFNTAISTTLNFCLTGQLYNNFDKQNSHSTKTVLTDDDNISSLVSWQPVCADGSKAERTRAINDSSKFSFLASCTSTMQLTSQTG